MSHVSQREFFQSVKEKFPDFFEGSRVLDVGSLDINGNSRHLFRDCEYIGLDLGTGPNVDVVSVAHEYDAPPFTVICSSSTFEHDMYIRETLANIVRLLSPGGLFFFTCSGDEGEHGTSSVEPWASPFTTEIEGWSDVNPVSANPALKNAKN